MKFPNWLKVLWWFLLVGVFAYLLYQRYDFIISGATTATDIVIFLILIALLVIPLFQEVSIFGVSFKKEIDSLRTEFKEQIISLKSEIQSTINIYPPTPPPDSQLSSIEEHIRPILEQTLKERGIEPLAPTPEMLTVPDDINFLFSVRYTIENELRRIWGQWWVSNIEGRSRPVLQIARSLADQGIIGQDFLSVLRDVYAASSSAIHGEEVSETAIGFVRQMSPLLIKVLKAIKR